MNIKTVFREALDWALFYWWAVVLVLIGFGVAYKFVAPPPPREIVIATGSETAGYHRFGQQLKAALETNGMKVTLHPTAGTIENFKLLADPASGVSVAFGQGGSEQYYDGDISNIRGLGSLYYEPLWIFYRKEAGITNFADFKHVKVAVGKKGSGTQMLSQVLLKENNIPETSWEYLGSADAIKAIQENKVQVMFLVGPVNDPLDRHKPNPDVYQLMADPSLALFGAKRAAAYVSRMPHLSVVTVGEGLIDLEHDYPPKNETLVAPLATLLCRSDLNGDIIMLILQTCRQIQSEGSWMEKTGEFPSKQGVTFPLMPEARQFLDKGPSFFYKFPIPFWVANKMNRLWIMVIPLLTIMLPLIKLALPTYRWRVRRKIATHYRVLNDIDRKIASGTIEKDLESDISLLQKYEDKLAHMTVPVMYSNDFYTLRGHVRYLRGRLEEIQKARDGNH